MTFALLPVKAPANAKHRLSGLLSPAEREQLARAMFQEVLAAVMAVRGLDRVVVASSDTGVLRRAAAAGAAVLPETSQNGHSASADWAARECMRMGAARLLLLPIDVPRVQPAEIELVLDAARPLAAPSLVIVPSADGTGTNALLRTPPDVIQSRFGPNSFTAHLAQARDKRIAVEVVRPEGLTSDLDTPEDLAAYLAKVTAGPTVEFLRTIHAAERLRLPQVSS